jgi:hypothetical protein
MKASEFITEIKKGQKDANGVTKCWPGYKASGTKKGKNGPVRNCVKNEGVAEGLIEFAPDNGGDDNNDVDPRLVKMAHDAGVVKGYSLADAATLTRAMAIDEWDTYNNGIYKQYFADGFKKGRLAKIRQGNEQHNLNLKLMKDGSVRHDKQGVAEDTELAEEFDLIESIIDDLAEHNGVDAEVIWEDLESLDDDELYVFATTTTIMETEAWQKANKKDKTDGMSKKAVKTYRREHPGSKLQTAVTTKPSKLKKGSKASKRRKSYCSRSRGQMKMHNISCAKTPDKAICKARRRWNCE